VCTFKLGIHSLFISIIIVVVFLGLGLLACSGFRTYFSVTYESIWTQSFYLHRTIQHTSMPRVGFEPTIPVFEWQKTVRA